MESYRQLIIAILLLAAAMSIIDGTKRMFLKLMHEIHQSSLSHLKEKYEVVMEKSDVEKGSLPWSKLKLEDCCSRETLQTS